MKRLKTCVTRAGGVIVDARNPHESNAAGGNIR
jgi:hypothetical protein